MSKFDYCGFYGGGEMEFAVNAEEYTKEQAIGIFEFETGGKVGDSKNEYRVISAYVRHRAGRNDDGEPCVGWWLEDQKHKRSCPVWAFEKAGV